MYEPRRPQVGEIWAYRVGRKPGTPVVPVEVLQLGPPTSKNKLRIKYLDGELKGLDEWVPKGRLQVKWDDAEPWMSDEVNLDATQKADWGESTELDYRAVDEVFQAISVSYPMHTGYNSKEYGVLEIMALDEVCQLLQIEKQELLNKPLAFIDRHGNYRAPFTVAVEVAKRACEVLPKQVLEHVAFEEAKDRRESVEGRYSDGYYFDPETCARWLAEHEPIYARVRDWCGSIASQEFDEVAALRSEIMRLRGVIEEIAREYRLGGHPRRASNLLKRLDPQEQ